MAGRLIVAPVVEGHGEYECVRGLLTRIGYDLCGAQFLHVCRPVRKPRSSLIKGGDPTLENGIGLAALNLSADAARVAGPVPGGLILVLLDAEDHCPGKLGPDLLGRATAARPDLPIAVTLANPTYETWFAAAADSLEAFLELADGETAPDKPESAGLKKKWVEDRFRGPKYSETVDQPRMTAAMDLTAVRDRCPSFARLCRVLAEALDDHPE